MGINLIKETLRAVSNYPGGYSTIYEMIYNEKPWDKSKNSLRTTLSRLKKKGLVSQKGTSWHITNVGKAMLLKGNKHRPYFTKQNLKTKQVKNTIVAFDIPEKNRKYRDWLRYELISFGFEFVQQSLWFGPSLPKEFIEYLHKEKLLQYIKIFKAKEEDLL
ncbi:hypothetical protein IT400_00285 [Candidatus Nomurabacteria bacterium]|nr:hypothetical protein [Candidatus Nomurabacteria bacterium]